MSKAFTLVELLVTLGLLGIIIVLAVAAINPIEQLNKAQDAKRAQNATGLQNAIDGYLAKGGESPDVLPRVDSYACSDIAQGEPVSQLGELSSELADWYARNVASKGIELYLGIDETKKAKVCYEVKALYNIKKVELDGCEVNSSRYLCIPN